MNILQLALRRIAVRATEHQILNTAKQFTTTEKIPVNYVPQIPSIKKAVGAFFLSFVAFIGASVFIGIISLLSLKLAVIIGYLVAVLFLINGIIVKTTSDKKTIAVQIEDRRFKTGFRDAGFLDIEDPDKQIPFTTVQRFYFFLENLFFAGAVVGACYFISVFSELIKNG